MTQRNQSDEEELEVLARIDQIKMKKRVSIQARRRCFYARTKESLGDYWVPRHGPRCTSHINPEHIRIPMRDCHTEHLEKNFKVAERAQVVELGDLIRKLGTIRYDFHRLIPVDYPSLEAMLDSLGKRKRHSMARASLNTRLLPEADKQAKVMESLRVLFRSDIQEDYDFSLLDGIVEELPSSVTEGDDYANLTMIYVEKAKKYKKLIKRTEFLFRKGRGLLRQLYDDQVDLFLQQDSIAEEMSSAFDQELLLGKNSNR